MQPCSTLLVTRGNMQHSDPSRRGEIADLYVRYGPLVTSRCRYLLRDRESAKDAAQEVFVKVMRSIEEFRSESSQLTWILRIATNHCLNVIASNRAKWRERYREYREHIDVDLSSSGEELERARIVRNLLLRFKPEVQEIAIHYYIDEMTQEEIAVLLHRSVPTVRKRLTEFVRIARKELGRDIP